MSVRLEPILEATRQRIQRCRREVSEDQLAGRIELGREGRPFGEALSRPGTSVIAEHKRRSPSAGTLREGASVREMTIAYERGGAAALSILTEEEHFGGSLDDLREAIAVTDLPVLRKDFTLDRYQLLEAKAAGADAVLLVVGALEPEQLADLYAEARELDLDALVEVHDRRELETALEIDADVVGINNRDLTDLTVDVLRTFDLLADVPAGKTVVSESGIFERAQIEELELVGIDAVLVGETLMRAADPEAAVRELARTEEPTQG